MNANENIDAGIAQDHTGTGRRSRGRRLGRGFLALAAAATATTSIILGTALASAGPASAATQYEWMMGAGTLAGMKAQDPALTASLLNAPGNTYGAGASLIASPIQPGLAATPVLSYTSYAQFSSDIQNHRITFPYQWVLYDPEGWSQTPVGEQQNPVKYIKLFGQLAHANGLKAIMAPSLDLAWVAGSVTPRLAGEQGPAWYVRAGLAGAAASAGDILDVQNESQTTNLQQYDWMFNNANAQAGAVNPNVQVFTEVSTVNGTPQQMFAAAKSVSADGCYVAAPGAVPQADQFFQLMKTAGY